MKKLFYLVGSVLMLLMLCVSCNRNTTPLEESYKKLKYSKITFPDDLQLTLEGKDTVMNGFLDSEFKLVVFRDSMSCNQCYVETFPQWDKLMCEFDSCYGKRLQFVFVLSPLQKDEADLRLNLQVIGFRHPIYLDMKKSFQRSNPQLPREHLLQVFLVDKENEVVMIGDPLTSGDMRQLLKKKIQNNSIIDNLFN